MTTTFRNRRILCALTAAIFGCGAGCTKPTAPMAQAPSRIEKFPADLDNQQLDQSGISPDGWTTPKVSLTLHEPEGSHWLVVRGMIPKIESADFHCEMELRVDGQPVGKKSLGIGEFSMETNVAPAPGNHRVEVVFSPEQILPNGDGRVIGMRVSSLGFESGAAATGAGINGRGAGMGLVARGSDYFKKPT